MFVTQPFTTSTRKIQHNLPPGLSVPPEKPSKTASSFADAKRTSYGLIIFSKHTTCNCLPLHHDTPGVICDEQIASHNVHTRECQIKLVMVENRCSYGFVDTIRYLFAHIQHGNPLKREIVFRHLTECSNAEQDLVRANTATLERLYKICFNRVYEFTAQQRATCITVKRLLEGVLECIPLNSGPRYNDIGFPKGHKMSLSETPVDCAKRETFEETGIKPDLYKIVLCPDGQPMSFTETFIGSDRNKYTHVYFLAHLIGDDSNKLRSVLSKAKKKRNCEIKNTYYVNIQQAFSLVRSTNQTKLNIIRKVFNVVV